MNQKFKKITSGLLAVALLTEAVPVYALTKDETVYAKLNADGSVKNTIVSEYLKNDGQETINDLTNLKNILNINGEETFELKDHRLIWKANGKDIYYQGETSENLPIRQTITYELNGKSISIDDLLGKKGHVTIHIKYTNTDKHLKNINGISETLYTPFVVTMGTIISLDKNSNVTVTNGKVISNGQNNIVVALASPGLYESLDIDELKDFDTITLEYDTTDFELNSMYSAISSKLISEEDLKVFDQLDNLYAKVNLLSDSSKQLVSGSEALLEGTKNLKSGVNSLNDGAKEAYDGSKTILSTVNDSINSLKNDTSEVLDETTLNKIQSEATSQALANYESQAEMIATAASNSVKESDTYKGLIEQYNELLEKSNQATLAANAYKNQMDLIPDQDSEDYKNLKKEYEKYVALAQQAVTGATTYQTMITLMEETAKQTAKETAKSVATTTASTVSSTVAKQVAQTAKTTFVNQTITSLTDLSQGLEQLSTGLKTLSEGTMTLYDGTSTLEDGVQSLTTGISKFDKEGIETLSNVINYDVKTTQQKLESLVKLGNQYDTFTMKSSEDDGETKFALVVDAQKKIEKKVETTKKEDTSKSLWQKIKELFKK